jgi:hypothetical protein
MNYVSISLGMEGLINNNKNNKNYFYKVFIKIYTIDVLIAFLNNLVNQYKNNINSIEIR